MLLCSLQLRKILHLKLVTRCLFIWTFSFRPDSEISFLEIFQNLFPEIQIVQWEKGGLKFFQNFGVSLDKIKYYSYEVFYEEPYIFAFSMPDFPKMISFFKLKNGLAVKTFKWGSEWVNSFPMPAWRMLHVVDLFCLCCIFPSVKWLPQCKGCHLASF